MIRRQPARARRSGAAAVEFAVIMNFVMVPLLFEVWEIGRMVQIQQIVSNSAREGARLAAQGRTLSTAGAITNILTAVNPPGTITGSTPVDTTPNVKAAVYQNLRGAGLTNLTWDDVTVTFKFLDQPAGATVGPTTTTVNPYDGVKNQRFQVYVSIPWAKVRWTDLGILDPTTLEYTVEWRMLLDDPFTVNADIPAY